MLAYFIDIQGTLIDDVDKKPIRGSVEFINALQSPFILVTNNTKTPSKEFFHYIKGLGYNIDEQNYIDPLMVLQEVLPPQKVAAYGDPKFLEILTQSGYELDYIAPRAVLVGMKKDFMPHEYAQMIELILNGAKLVGMHATTIYAKEGRKYPGIGAIMAMLAYATNCEYEIVGKPSKTFYQKALQKVGADSFASVQMISDDLVGDLVGIKRLGAKTTLVQSGKIKDASKIIASLDAADRPDFVYQDIGKMS
ncbi:MAG: HAD-IIA family hydrolase [Campylobacterota bacterium]